MKIIHATHCEKEARSTAPESRVEEGSCLGTAMDAIFVGLSNFSAGEIGMRWLPPRGLQLSPFAPFSSFIHIMGVSLEVAVLGP